MPKPSLRTLSTTLAFLGTLMGGLSASEDAARTLSLDLKQTSGPQSVMWRQCVGAGRVGEGLRPEWQAQIRTVKAELGFERLRCHGLYHDELNVYHVDAQGKEVYDFSKIDQVYDVLVKTGVRPFVEFGFVPQDMASGTQTIFWWKGNVTTPKDMGAWGRLIGATARHWVERYGINEVVTWNFEIWNEPNLGGFLKPIVKDNSFAEYGEIYRAAAKALKEVDPRLQVGGPAAAGASWNEKFVAWATEAKVPLDFLSFHTYSTHKGVDLDEFGRMQIFFNDNLHHVADYVRGARKKVEAGPRPGLPIHLTEWSTSPSARDPSHDAYQSAPFILEQIKHAGDAVNSMSYWVFTDIFEESGPVTKPFQGCFGLMTKDSIRKPTWFAYAFLNRLGSTALKGTDAHSLATTDDAGGVQVLVWDYRRPAPDKVSNQSWFMQDHPAQDLPPVAVTITALTPGDYDLTRTRVGYRANDAYTPWLVDLKKPDALTPDQFKTLQQASSGAPEQTARVTVGADGRYATSIPLREFDGVLLSLKPVKTP